jgi:CheY-like chemotaxis protein
MAERPAVRVLVVEDNHEWNEALKGMYRRILAPMNPIVQGTRSGVEALERLESEQFDIVSLDINLTEVHPVGTDGAPNAEVPGFDGTDVLEKVQARRSARIVVVVTGVPANAKLAFVVGDRDKRIRLQTTPNEFLRTQFAGKSYYFVKPGGASPAECIQQIENVLTLDSLKPLLAADGFRIPPPYLIDADHSALPARITIKSRRKAGRSHEVRRSDHRLFLDALVRMHREYGQPLSDEGAKRIYGQYHTPGSAIDSLKRELRREGVDPDELFVRVRQRGAVVGGYALAQGVSTRGWASITKRGIEADWTANPEDETA